MKLNSLLSIILFFFIFSSCQKKDGKEPVKTINWDKREMPKILFDSLFNGSTYLSVYSEIYTYTESRTYDLTATVSMKNIYKTDTLYIQNADYYNSEGKLIRAYLDKPIYLFPMETLEIIINQKDKEGGSGGNFVFDWAVKKENLEPHFEAVMISTYGQQGLSFTSQGIRVN